MLPLVSTTIFSQPTSPIPQCHSACHSVSHHFRVKQTRSKNYPATRPRNHIQYPKECQAESQIRSFPWPSQRFFASGMAEGREDYFPVDAEGREDAEMPCLDVGVTHGLHIHFAAGQSRCLVRLAHLAV